MSVTFTAASALWLLLALPLVWIAPRFGRTNFNRRQRAVQAGLRSLLVAVLACALARPVLLLGSSRQSIVYAVDVSYSIGTPAIQAAAATIDDLNRAIHPADSRIVAFGRTTMRVESTEALRRLAREDPTSVTTVPIDRSGTDLEAALDAARAELARGHVPRIVLFTDGRSTGGETAQAVARLAAARIPVSVEPMAVRSLGDVWIESLDLPDRIGAGATFDALVTIGSQRAGEARVVLQEEGRQLAERAVTVSKGVTRATLEARIDRPGSHSLEASVVVAGDPLEANNVLVREAWTEPRPKVLYVERTAASARYLSNALTSSGFDVTVRNPSGLPSSAASLDRFDVLILSDVPRSAISDGSMTAMSQWVEQGGGGLLVAGGEAVYGEKGYRRTTLERLTPVTFERTDEPEVALVLVLDRSLSMSGRSMDLCKTAAQAAVDVMKDEQAIGVLTFNDKFEWAVTLRTIGGNRDEIRKRIAAIEPGGNTLFYPAMEQAYLALRATKARAKHVVMLSDGRSYPADYESLIEKMVDARITLSTVAIGQSANPELLRNFATWGKGRSYVSEDARQLPQIFVTEARNAANPSFDEKEIVPVVKAPAFLTGVDIAHLPHLKGRTATVLKDTALEVAATRDEEPLLAFWPIGLGRSAVFASDVKDRWAANWVKWRGYGPFFTSVVRTLARQPPMPLALDVVPGPVRNGERSIRIALEARDPQGLYRDLLHPSVQVSRLASNRGDRPLDVPLHQVAPGRYEATLLARAADELEVRAASPGDDETDKMSGVTSRIVLPDAAAEYRFKAADERLLRSMALATGGEWRPSAAALRNGGSDRRTDRRPLWQAFVSVGLCLWFVDIVFRRIRVFEPVVRKGDH
jgi:Ca-activated chloride channel family protein